MADEEVPPPPPTLDSMFMAFAQFGAESGYDGSKILLSQLDMWMKQSKIFTKTFTITDTGMAFSIYKQSRIDFETFQEYLEKLCKDKNLDQKEVEKKMIECGTPGLQRMD